MQLDFDVLSKYQEINATPNFLNSRLTNKNLQESLIYEKCNILFN